MEDYDSLGARQEPYENTELVIAEDFNGDELLESDDAYTFDNVNFKDEDLHEALNSMSKEGLVELLGSFRYLEIIRRCGIERCDYV